MLADVTAECIGVAYELTPATAAGNSETGAKKCCAKWQAWLQLEDPGSS